MEQMGNSKLVKVVEDLEIWLDQKFPDWKQNSQNSDSTHYIRKMLDFSAGYQIRKELNVRHVIEYHIRYCFQIPLHKNLESCLVQYQWNEDYRMENFYCSLVSGRYHLEEITIYFDSII